MEVVAVAGVAVVAAFLSVLLKQHRPELAMGIGLVAGTGILMLLLRYAIPMVDQLREMLSKSGVSGEYVTVLFKALGVCLLTQLASDTCKDAGEQALASKAELAGKISLLVLALPLFQKLADLALSLIRYE